MNRAIYNSKYKRINGNSSKETTKTFLSLFVEAVSAKKGPSALKSKSATLGFHSRYLIKVESIKGVLK